MGEVIRQLPSNSEAAGQEKRTGGYHKLANGAERIDFQTDPSRYRHWKLSVDGVIATLTLDVEENGGLFEGYPLPAQLTRRVDNDLESILGSLRHQVTEALRHELVIRAHRVDVGKLDPPGSLDGLGSTPG